MKRLAAVLAMLLPCLAFSRAVADLPDFQYTYGAGQLVNPVAIALGLDSLVFVADAGSREVVVFSDAGEPRTSFPVGATPAGLAVAPDGTVWVTTSDTHEVRAFGSTGTWVRTLASAVGNVPGAFSFPHAVACLGDGSVLVHCDSRDRCLRFTSGGDFLREFATGPGIGNTGAFDDVPQLAVFADTTVLFAWPWFGEVHRLTLTGDPVAGYPRLLGGAYGVAVDIANQQAYSTFQGGIVQFSAAGDTLGSIPPDPARWAAPGEMATDRRGHLHVIVGGGRIARFGLGPDPVRPATWGAIKARYR